LSLLPRYHWKRRLAPELPGTRGTTGYALLDALLHSRSIQTPEAMRRYLDPLSGPALSPFEVPGVHEATALIRWAIARDQRILVHGDYDADGLSATALLVRGLLSLGARARAFIPNRLDTGYGLSLDTVAELAAGAELLITVDCGIRSIDEVARARELGMSVIVSDHHLPGPALPAADALVTTRLPSSPVTDELAGVGVAYQIWRGLEEVSRRFGGAASSLDGGMLDLVALGTVADVAPLVGENRRLVRAGLLQLRRSTHPGLAALAHSAGIEPSSMSAESISFGLAPRINAAGRLGSAEPALELLLTEDVARAQQLAQELSRANRVRQDEVQRCLERAQATRPEADLRDSPLIFTVSDEYPQGIVGLVAGKLADSYAVPVVAVTLEGDKAHGSIRSPEWFNASEALEGCSRWLDKHGGHSKAAGFTCAAEAIDRVEQHLRDRAERACVDGTPRAELEYDAELPPVLPDQPVWEHLALLEPVGEGNPAPVFVSRAVPVLRKSSMGRDGVHLRLLLRSDDSEIGAVAFRRGEALAQIGDRVDIAYTLDEHTYNGSTERRLNIVDLAEPGQGG